jgi:carbamoylphosphate synthase small subunit
MRGVVARGTQPTREALLALDACPPMEGLDLASVVSTPDRYDWGRPTRRTTSSRRLRHQAQHSALFAEHGCRVTVVPAKTSADEALQLGPDGVFRTGRATGCGGLRPETVADRRFRRRSSASASATRSLGSRSAPIR